MNTINMAELFSIPPDYLEPPDIELKANTQHPNLNSREYMKKFPDTTIVIQKFYEKLIVNCDGNVILACNNYTGRIWNGSVWGFHGYSDVGDPEKNLFKLQSVAAVTDICFVDKNHILLADASGSVQYWSTLSEKNDYSLSMLGNRYEHTGIINAIDVFRLDRTKAVSVSTDCSIKLWEISENELLSYNTMSHAHYGSITGVSTSNECPGSFVTCSSDKSVILWDYRQFKPATGLIENHECGFTSIYWTTETEDNNLVAVGDDKGQVHVIDTRKPNEFVESIEVFDRRIQKIAYKDKIYVVCGNTNELKAYDSTTRDLVYTCRRSKNYVRDICWDLYDSNLFYSIDWDAKIKKHLIIRAD